MRGWSAILAVGLPLVVGVSAVQAQGSIWKKFSPEQGAFSVVMPGIPKAQKSKDLALYELTREAEKVRYAVGYIELAIAPGEDERLTREVFDGIQSGVENQKGTLLSFRSVKLAGQYPGREMTFLLPDDFRAKWRVYIVGKRTYFLNATTTQANLSSGLAKSVEVFLSSFQVKVPKVEETPTQPVMHESEHGYERMPSN